MVKNKEYNEFRNKWMIIIRKNNKYKYTPIDSLNKFIKRKWIKKQANEEYGKYIIDEKNKKTKVTFSNQNDIKEFDKELPPNNI